MDTKEFYSNYIIGKWCNSVVSKNALPNSLTDTTYKTHNSSSFLEIHPLLGSDSIFSTRIQTRLSNLTHDKINVHCSLPQNFRLTLDYQPIRTQIWDNEPIRPIWIQNPIRSSSDLVYPTWLFLAKLEIIKNGRQFVWREQIIKFALTCRWSSALKYALEPQSDFNLSLIGSVIEFAQITLKIARKG